MANRVLRDWTTSESLDEISAEAERLFTRLIMKADDYGSFHSNAKLIRAACFPLKEIKDSRISEWLTECIEAGLIFKYKVDGKEYIRIKNFNQRLRNMRQSFPQPLSGEPQQVAANGGDSRPETKRNETEEETETETKLPADETPPLAVWPSFEDFWQKYDKHIDRPKCEKKWKKINQQAREKILEHLALYVGATPDRQYRKNPLTYLNNESWKNEIIIPHGKHNGITAQGTLDRLNSYDD
jgi:hypothetical protein